MWGNWVEVDVNGVGYLVYVGLGFVKKHSEGEEVLVRTYLAVSENDMALYGFDSIEDLDLFKMLITVSGVGPKTAAQILGSTDSLSVIKAIGDADVEFFKKLKGIGLKTSQRIIVDLKSKIGGLGELDLTDKLPLLEDDVMLSLKQLGFDRREIDKVVQKIPAEIAGTEERLSWCLQNLG
jgi:holliday junction DNA helicase RuvA